MGYHWLFFRLQEMHNDDLRKIKKTRKVKNQGKEPKNPLTILEWEAKQGSRALMMPESIIRPIIETYRAEERKTHNHAGFVYENVCHSISEMMGVPKYLVKGRMMRPCLLAGPAREISVFCPVTKWVTSTASPTA